MTLAAQLVVQEPYRPRAIRFLEMWEHESWTLKVYGIRYGADRPDATGVTAAKKVAAERLTTTGVGDGYGVGFVGIHQGRGSTFVFVDWWANENELRHFVYCTDGPDILTLRPATEADSVACVWDLRVMQFEREAWVETVLANPNGPDLDAYLNRQLSGDF